MAAVVLNSSLIHSPQGAPEEAEVIVGDTSITHRYYDFGEMPERIELSR